MNLARVALVSFVALALAACSSASDDGSGDDQNATAQNAPNPALLKVTHKSTVGVLLDGAPDVDALEKKLIADSTGGKKDQFWKERAKRQMRLLTNRLYYRGGYYPGGL